MSNEESLGRSSVSLVHRQVADTVFTVTDGFAAKYGCELLVMTPLGLRAQSAQTQRLYVTVACRAFREQEVAETLKFAHNVSYFLDLSEVQGIERLIGLKYQNLSTVEISVVASHYDHIRQNKTVKIVQCLYGDPSGFFPGEQGYDMWGQDCTVAHEDSVMPQMFVSLTEKSTQH